jgi:hypothetical protein
MKEELEKDKKKDDDHGKDEVIVTVDGVEKTIHRGSHTVADIKRLTGVSEADKLAILIDNILKPLKDEDRITIKGGEAFRVVPSGGTSS